MEELNCFQVRLPRDVVGVKNCVFMLTRGTRWLESLCFLFVFCFWNFEFCLVGEFWGVCCDHAGEVYLTEPVEW